MGEQKKPDIWMPLYVADYQADTAYLTTEQHGAYLLMLMAYWRNGPIPDNDQIIASITKQTPDAWSITRAVLEPMFRVSDGYWFHARVEREYEKAKRNRSVSHERSVRAAKARWEKERMHQAMLQALPEHMLEQCPSPSPTTSQSKATSKAKEPPVVPQGGHIVPGGSADEKPKRLARAKRQLVTLPEYLESCRAEGVKPIPENDPIREWANEAGIPDDFMRLAWVVFSRDWSTKKPQKDWPATFRDAVRRNWLKLWYIDADGRCVLTTVGQQEWRIANG